MALCIEPDESVQRVLRAIARKHSLPPEKYHRRIVYEYACAFAAEAENRAAFDAYVGKITAEYAAERAAYETARAEREKTP